MDGRSVSSFSSADKEIRLQIFSKIINSKEMKLCERVGSKLVLNTEDLESILASEGKLIQNIIVFGVVWTLNKCMHKPYYQPCDPKV